MVSLPLPTLLAIAVAALLTAVLHGSTGLAGGIVMASILAHLIGIKAAVPAMTVALILSHTSRAALYVKDTDWPTVRRVLLFGSPAIVAGALIFAEISPRAVAIVFAMFLLASLPVRRWSEHHEIRTGPKLLAVASIIWGLLAGNVIGPGFFLAPFLLGTGMSRLTFVGTLATITLVMNTIKTAVFGVTGIMSTELFMLGAAIGLITIPGNWAGRAVLRRMTDRHHRAAIDFLTLAMIANFLYLSSTGGP